MNKKTLLNKISARTNQGQNRTGKIFNRVLNLIQEEISRKKYCRIENFGDFVVEHRKQILETGKKRGEDVMLPPKDKLRFYPSQNLIKLINSDERKSS